MKKASVRPTRHAYLRALFSDAAAQPSRRTVCTDCLRVLRHRRKHLDFAPRQLHTLGPRPNATHLQGAVRFAQSTQRRRLATVTDVVQRGPLEEYDERVQTRRLRDDEHQRSEQGRFRDSAKPELTLQQRLSNICKICTTHYETTRLRK